METWWGRHKRIERTLHGVPSLIDEVYNILVESRNVLAIIESVAPSTAYPLISQRTVVACSNSIAAVDDKSLLELFGLLIESFGVICLLELEEELVMCR